MSKPFFKRFLKSSFTQALLAFLFASYIRLVMLTSRITREIHPDALPYVQGENNAIFALWHGRMMVLPALYTLKRPIHVLISGHRDGKMISQVIAHFNQSTVEGSSSRGGRAAAVGILKLLKAGNNIAITPDGPRGPFQVAAEGVTMLARLSGKPILPITFSASGATHLQSWDRFMLAKPFSRIQLCIAAPIWVTRKDEPEQARQHFEQVMNSLVKRADGALKSVRT